MTSPADSALRSIAGAQWLDWPETRQVFSALMADGDEVRAVGGAVRDTLLSRTVRDVDLATPAPPERVAELANKAGLKVVLTGIDHGTVTVLAGQRPFEVTTLRKDVETYGRQADVAYTDDWSEDARRRDFTINALYAGADGTLYDPLGVIDDIAARKLRFIGEARERVREDYLRILRFFRFHAELELDGFDAEGLSACVRERDGLAHLSSERVAAELSRLLQAPGAVQSIEKMFSYGLLVDVIGCVPQLERFRNLVKIEAELDQPADPILRLAALALWTSSDVSRLFERLRLSNADKAKLEAASDYRGISADTYDSDVMWALYRQGRDDFTSAALLAWAATGAPPGDPLWRGMIAKVSELEVPVFPVNGADIIKIGVAEGPAVGELLKALEVHWMATGFEAEKKELLDVAKELSAQATQS